MIARSGMADGMAILDLGCGWGSGSLHYAARLPNALVVGVSNSHSQRAHILADAARKGITNLDVVTCDVSREPFAERAAAALATLAAARGSRPGAAAGAALGFNRVVSLEMFEHMKNYEELLKNVADVRAAPAGPPAGARALARSL